ncbi:MAG: hypothetical protein WA704_27470, partial [Pseudolabrys sp.]
LGLSTFAHYAVAGAHTPPSVGRAFPICLRDHSCEREDSIHASRNIGSPRAWHILYEREREGVRIGTMRRLTSVKREAQA